ncbi:MAG: MFS transporter [Bacteroidetes bacterium]|nr:MFS transporter [Bacteroidota bacterium]
MREYTMRENKNPTQFLTRTIVILSAVSLFTDVASEMLYPVMPLYLTSIGFSVAFIGVLEGIAEATAGISKGFFGYLSDQLGTRKPFVQVGYSLSAIAKPMIGLWTAPVWIFIARTLERLGKGIRTGARDAMLSDESKYETKGRVFGFHRAFDTLGAALGPLIALFYLLYYPMDYRMLFFLAFIPGLIASILTFFLREGASKPLTRGMNISYNPIRYLAYWKEAPTIYKRLVIALLAFAVVNSSDVFLLLAMKQQRMNDTAIIGVYIFYNLIYAFTSYPFGALADRIGLKTTFLLGLFFFALVYSGMAIATSWQGFIFLFFFYGMYAAATEGISRAWISNSVEPYHVATAIGFYTSLQSISTLLASSIAGILWVTFGPKIVFISTAIVVYIIILYIMIAINER